MDNKSSFLHNLISSRVYGKLQYGKRNNKQEMANGLYKGEKNLSHFPLPPLAFIADDLLESVFVFRQCELHLR